MEETIGILVELLDGWRKLLLRDGQCAAFLAWLRNHAKREFQAETFKEELGAWLSSRANLKELYAEVLIVHAEILWTSAYSSFKLARDNNHAPSSSLNVSV